MKAIWIGSLALLVASAASASPDKQRDLAEPRRERSAAMPASMDGGEARPGNGLRDVLRRPFDEADGGGQPYRLSAEERQRLREQLRGQPHNHSGQRP